eukprot:Gb_16429 [translate_table: standard]
MMNSSSALKIGDQVFPMEQSLVLPVVKHRDQDPFSESFDAPAVPARHWRSRSAPDNESSSENWDISPRPFHHFRAGWKRVKRSIENKKQSPSKDRQTILKQDVAQLEMKLQDQLAVREALEGALGHTTTTTSLVNGNHVPKPTEEMIKEIALLELEVAHLENHLLSLYRKVFQQHFSVWPSLTLQDSSEPAKSQSDELQQLNGLRRTLKQAGNMVHRSHSSLSQSSAGSFQLLNGPRITEKQTSYAVQRSHSSLSQVSSTGSVTRRSPPLENSSKAGLARYYHSQPLSLEQEPCLDEGCNASLADHLGTSKTEHVHETANKVSEDLVCCMAAIYCKLANPPLLHMALSNSPTSSLSSASTFSPQDQSEFWSPQCKTDRIHDVRLINPFQVKGQEESIGPYSSMIEVPWICVDNDRLSYAARMLHNFSCRSLVRRLENVEPRKMKHEEKLAFWINIYNALIMHAYLAYGIPRNHLKRIPLLLKAAYKVGGHSINAHIIENTILGCRSHRPAQWLETLLSPGIKLKVGDERQAYALDHPEPLVCFALCCGGYSDPAVRAYTAKNIYQELEVAKEEYIRASIGIRKGNKVLLPKVLEGFARDTSLSSSKLLDMICQCLPEPQRNDIRRCSQTKAHKSIEWVPYNFSFRYIFSRALAKWLPPAIK